MVRRWFATHPKLVDRIIAVTYVVASIIALVIDLSLAFTSPASAQTFGILFVVELVTIAVICWMLLMRRPRPLIAFIVTAICAIPSLPDGIQGVGDAVALMYLIYAVAVFGTVKKAWIAYGVAGLTTWLQLVVDALGGSLFGVSFSAWMSIMVMYLIVLLIAINIGNRRRYIDALIDRADYLERDRDQLARIAVAEERERIAREMHDIVAHSLSVMIALSEGSNRAVHTAPDKAADAMLRSAETGRTALSEMRRLLGVLKGNVAEAELEMAPQPGIGNLQALVEDFRQAGMTIRQRSEGVAPDDSGIGLAVYRIVQESLTNALRYAGIGATVDLSVVYGPPETIISVRDYGRVATGTRTMDNLGTGNGLQGLAERTRMFGGELRAGAHPEGGWMVMATLPMNGTI